MFSKRIFASMALFAVMVAPTVLALSPFLMPTHNPNRRILDCPPGSIHVGRSDIIGHGPVPHCVNKTGIITYETFEGNGLRPGLDDLKKIQWSCWNNIRLRGGRPPYAQFPGDATEGPRYTYGRILYHDAILVGPSSVTMQYPVHNLFLPSFCVAFSFFLQSNIGEITDPATRPTLELYFDFYKDESRTERVSELLWSSDNRKWDVDHWTDELNVWSNVRLTPTIAQTYFAERRDGDLQFRFETKPMMEGSKPFQIGVALDELFYSVAEQGVKSYCDM